MSNSLRFQSYELSFAQQLGVDLDERFATELLKLAIVGMNSLPNGWELNFTETDGGQAVYFYNSNDNWSTWSHPNQRLYIQMIENKRKELIRKYPPSNAPDGFAGTPTGVATINANTHANTDLDYNAAYLSSDGIDPMNNIVQDEPQLPILTESSLQQHNLLTSSSQSTGTGKDKTITSLDQVDGDEYGGDMFFTGIFSEDDESKGVLSDGIAAIGIDQQDNSYEDMPNDAHHHDNKKINIYRRDDHSHSFSNHNAHNHNGPMSTFLHYDAGINAALPPLSEENSQYFDLTASSVLSGHTSSLMYQADVNSLLDNSLNHIETINDDDHDIMAFLQPMQPRYSSNINNTETNDDGTKLSGKRSTKPPIRVTSSAKTKARSAALIAEAKQRAEQRQSSDNSLINDNDSVNSYISDNSDTYNKSMFGAVRSKFASLYSTVMTKANALSALTSTVLQKAVNKQNTGSAGSDNIDAHAEPPSEGAVEPVVPSEVFIIEEIPMEIVDDRTYEISNIINDDINKEKGIAENKVTPVAGAYHNTDTRDTAKSPVGSDTSGLESIDFVDKMFADILLTPQGTRRKSKVERDQQLTQTEAENKTEKPDTAPSVKSITMDGESWLTPVLVAETNTISTDMADPIVLISPQNYTKHINHFPLGANKLLIDELWGSSDDITAVSPHSGPSTDHLSEKTYTAEESTIGTGMEGCTAADESRELQLMTAQDRDAGFYEFEGVASEYFHSPDHSLFSSKISLCDLAAANGDHRESDNNSETVFSFCGDVGSVSLKPSKLKTHAQEALQPFSASPKASNNTKILPGKDEIGMKTPVLIDLDTDYSSLSLFDFADQSRKVFDTTTAHSSPVNLPHRAPFISPCHTHNLNIIDTTNVDCVEMMTLKLNVFNFAERWEPLTHVQKATMSQSSDPMVYINESVFRFPSMRSIISSPQAHTLSNSPEQPLPNKTQLIPLKVNASATDTVTGSILGVTPEISPLSMTSTATSTDVSSPTNKPNTTQQQPQSQPQQQSSPTQKSQLKSMLSFISKNATKFDVDVTDYLGSEKKPYQQITTIHDIPSSIVQATALQGIAPPTITTARHHGGDILSHFHSIFKPNTAELLSLEASEMHASRNNNKHKRDWTSGHKGRKVVTISGSTRKDNKVHKLSPLVGFISAADLLQKSHDVSGKGLHTELSMPVYYNNVSGGGRGRNGRHNPTAPSCDEDSDDADVDGGKTSKTQWYPVPNKYFATYKKATQAKEALDQVLTTKIEQMFVSHSRRHSQSLPELKPKGGHNSDLVSAINHENSDLTANNSNSYNSSSTDRNRPNNKETSANHTTLPHPHITRHLTKESSGTENLNYHLEIRRDTVRMQWKLECNNQNIIRVIQKHYESEALATELQSSSLRGLPPPVAAAVAAQGVINRAHSHNGKVTKVHSSNAVKHVRSRQTSLTTSNDGNDIVSRAVLPALPVVQPKLSMAGKRRKK